VRTLGALCIELFGVGFAADCTAILQIGYLPLREAQFGQYFGVVFAQSRRPPREIRWRAFKICRRAGLAQSTGYRVSRLEQNFVGDDLGVFDDFAPGQHGRRGHTLPVKYFKPLGGGFSGQHLLQQRQALIDIFVSERRRFKSRIVEHFRLLECPCQRGPLLVSPMVETVM